METKINLFVIFFRVIRAIMFIFMAGSEKPTIE